MKDVRREIEIKLRFDSADDALERLRQLGPKLLQERVFEDNVLFDRRHDPLKPQGKLLRLRRAGSRSWLTYKAPVGESDRHRVRQEEETQVSDHEGMRRILTGLGFSPWYRYQKHRTVFEVEELQVCLDETPLGCFLELEGAPEAIDRTAVLLGFDAEDYIRESYRELHEQAARELGEEPGDLLVSDLQEDNRPR